MLGTVKYEIKELYRDSTVYGFWKDDKEISVPVREIKKDEADKFIDLLISIGAKHYETSNKYNDIVIRTNKKFIKLIDLVQTSINNPNADITYDLDLFKYELQEENNRIESEKEYI